MQNKHKIESKNFFINVVLWFINRICNLSLIALRYCKNSNKRAKKKKHAFIFSQRVQSMFAVYCKNSKTFCTYLNNSRIISPDFLYLCFAGICCFSLLAISVLWLIKYIKIVALWEKIPIFAKHSGSVPFFYAVKYKSIWVSPIRPAPDKSSRAWPQQR